MTNMITINNESEGRKLFYADNPICDAYDEIGVYANSERHARSIIRDVYDISRLPVGYGVYIKNPYAIRHEIAQNCKNGANFIDWY